MPSDAWLGTCNVPSHEDLAAQLEQLKELVQLNGFEVVEGDFTRRDGSRSRFFLRPNNVDRLLRVLQLARRYEEHKPA